MIIDKELSCFDVLDVFRNNDSEDLIIWNSETSSFSAKISYSEIIELLLYLIKKNFNKKKHLHGNKLDI